MLHTVKLDLQNKVVIQHFGKALGHMRARGRHVSCTRARNVSGLLGQLSRPQLYRCVKYGAIFFRIADERVALLALFFRAACMLRAI